jgi:hypothetical protein
LAEEAAGCSGGKSGLAPAAGSEGEPGAPLWLETTQPGVEGAWLADPEQPGTGPLGGGEAVCPLEEGGGAFPEIGFGSGVA